MDTQEIFTLMETCKLGFEDFRYVLDSASAPVQYSFWHQAHSAYDQAAYDPHKWGDSAGTIADQIAQLPIYSQRFSYAEAQAHESEYTDLFISVYTTKWGQAPESHLVEQERHEYLIPFVD